MRQKSYVYEAWQRLGYTDDPMRVHEKDIEQLTFDQIQTYYQNHVQGRPLAILIVGDPKQIDMKQLNKIAKVKRVSLNDLFAPLDLD